MRIYLIGYMGSGKTTVGKKLARLLDYQFIDLDEIFEEKYHLKITDFFVKYDEQAFREIESNLIKETEQIDNVVISTGGGAPCFNNNLSLMKGMGLTVYLQMSIPALVYRLTNAKRVRPLLKDMNENELTTFITEQLKLRDVFYKKAQIIVNGENSEIEILAQSIKLHPLFK
ncbi:MAG: shikimate kinase [Bacteroidetes bacterium]|nr:shikimate kinase [Bacteroidota bacterium]